MSSWLNQETGELIDAEGCPMCHQTRDDAENQMHHMELDLRVKRRKITKLENDAERDIVAKRDGATWKRILNAWLAAFPDKRPTAKGVKSARATKVFLRLESGAEERDVLDAIEGARQYPYVVFGKRRSSGAKSDLADDLEDICAVKKDGMFDWLRDVGAQDREDRALNEPQRGVDL